MLHLHNVLGQRGAFKIQIPEYKVRQGEIHIIRGPSGCGKTTFLNLLAHQQKMTSGHYTIDNKPSEFLSDKNNRHATMAYLMQSPYLFDGSVFENAALGLRIAGKHKTHYRPMIKRLLESLNIQHLADTHVKFVSGGEAQRTAIARALAMDVPLILMDEPTVNIDEANISCVESVIRQQNKRGTAFIITSHQRGQAARLGAKRFSLIGGRLEKGPMDNVLVGWTEKKSENRWMFLSNQGLELSVGHSSEGKTAISIGADEIILSLDKMRSSALNSFSGTVQKIELEAGNYYITVKAIESFAVSITRQSFEHLSIAPGNKIWLTFKATAIKCWPL